jgi:hypothetical protein
MKTIKLLLLFVFVATVSCAQQSPREQAEGNIDGVAVIIDYGAPSVKGRTIWGGLESYGKVWRAGANGNTTISFDKNVMINGKDLSADTYGFFIIPNEKGDWTVIFNKKNDEWGAFSYNQEEDALRVNITPKFTDDNQEQLKYSVEENTIEFAWEKARLTIPVSSK